MRLIGGLKIRTRLYAGFGCLIALGLFIAVAGSWGISTLAEQSRRTGELAGNLRYVADAVEAAERIAQIQLTARNDPDAAQHAQFQQLQQRIQTSLTTAKAHSLSPARQQAYQDSLDKVDRLAQSAGKSFTLGATMLEGRGRLFTGGDALTAATKRMVDAVSALHVPEATARAEASERANLLVRIANWRFLATRDSGGIATFANSQKVALAALDSVRQQNIASIAPVLREVQADLAAYADAFNVTAPAMLTLADTYDKVQRPLVDDIGASLSHSEDDLAADIAAAITLSAQISSRTLEIQKIVGVLALFGGVILAYLIGRGIAAPITRMTSVMGALAGGNTDVTVPSTENTDEIGDMARAVGVFRTSMIEAKRLSEEQEAARAARSRRQDMMDTNTEKFGASVGGVMGALAAASDRMRRAADVMTEAAAAVHSQASETAGGASKSSADLTSVAAAVEEFTSSVAEISRQVSVSSQVASQAVERANASQSIISSLAEATGRIGDVVRLIDSIARQTNLLALNATIESARAGDAGKGFAVVAGEVKALAGQTAKATAEIAGQIETVRAATENVVEAMGEISSIIGRMGEVSTAISAAVEEQSATTREIAAAIQGVTDSTTHAARAMENVVEVADRAGGASRNIIAEVSDMSTESDKLRKQVEEFLHAVQNDAGERRLFERISGQGVTATLHVPGDPPTKVQVQDLSRGGAALRYREYVATGSAVQLDLPDAGGQVTGRVIRSASGLVAISFSEEPAIRARVDKALAALSGVRKAA